MKKILILMLVGLIGTGCSMVSNQNTATKIANLATNVDNVIPVTKQDTCTWPQSVVLDNQTLITLGMPDLEGGAQMEFEFDDAQELIAAESLIGLSTGPNFVSYELVAGDIKSARFMADAYTPTFSEEGDFLGIDRNQITPLQDTTFYFAADDTVTVTKTLEPNMEELMLILNPPLEPYTDWFTYHLDSTYEFFELWKDVHCAQ
jgi:hypothetical protein